MMFCICSYGQDPHYINYSLEDGLRSNQFYDSYQDEKGYMWFTSDRGVVQYDGYSFKTYTTIDGLANLVNFDIYKENDKRFWVNGLDGTFSYWNGTSFNEFKYNHKLQQLIKGKRWFRITNITKEYIYFIEDNADLRNQIFLKIHKENGTIDAVQNNYKNIIGKNISDRSKFRLNYPKISARSDTLCYAEDKDGTHWILTRNGVFKDNSIYFKSIPISSLTENTNGSLWFTTLNKGLLYVPSLKIKTLAILPENKKLFRELKSLDNYMIGYFAEDYLNALFYQNDTTYFFSRFDDELSIKKGLKKFRAYNDNSIPFDHDIIKGRLPLSNGDYFTKNPNSTIVSIQNNKIKIKLLIKISVQDGFEDYNSKLWLATNDGLYFVDLKAKNFSLDKYILNSKIDKSRLVNIHPEKKGMWITSLSDGLYFKKDSIIKIQHPKLEGKTFETSFKENDSTLWIGTNTGLLKIKYNLNSGNPKVVKVSNFTQQDGLSGNQINHVIKFNEYLYVATNNGICYFQSNDLKKKNLKPKLYIDEFLVNGEFSSFSNLKKDLKYNQNNLKISFTGISNDKPSKPGFFYRYKLNKEDWKYTNNRSVEYHLLSPNNYTFTVQCQNSSGLWSEVSQLDFSIAPHFTNRLSFKIALLCIILLIMVLIIQNRISASKEKLKTNILLKESELATLRNQMNPHFVFNSLNTLQDFIFEGDVEKANKYIGDFANLMRKSLEFSKLDKITLQEEILFIENYLQLEKKRFEDKFDFSIQTNVDLSKYNVFVIPLLIQPLVENAVKHAFKKLENKVGLIRLTYNKINEDYIQIEVQDNGSGYDPRQEQKRTSNHQSMGIQIIKQRIELLNQKSQNNDYKLIFKKLDEGTKVTLKLPIYKT